MGAGFAVMYLLIIVNSVYFKPQFGLNILDKKSEIGVFVAMLASVMMCVGGYLNFRTKFDEPDLSLEVDREKTAEVVPTKAILTETAQPKAAEQVFNGGISREAVTAPTIALEKTSQREPIQSAKPLATTADYNAPTYAAQTKPSASANYSAERELRGKTDYERSKMYENLKKMMMKDTLTPDQRRKEREKQAKENAFSANFGKTEPITTGVAKVPRASGGIDELLRKGQLKKEGGAANEKPDAKKPQMYRMDL